MPLAVVGCAVVVTALILRIFGLIAAVGQSDGRALAGK